MFIRKKTSITLRVCPEDKFHDFTSEEVDSAPNWVTAVNFVSFFAALGLVFTAFVI